MKNLTPNKSKVLFPIPTSILNDEKNLKSKIIIMLKSRFTILKLYTDIVDFCLNELLFKYATLWRHHGIIFKDIKLPSRKDRQLKFTNKFDTRLYERGRWIVKLLHKY